MGLKSSPSVLLVATLAISTTSGAVETGLSRMPYVQNLGRTEVTILWRTHNHEALTLEYGRSVSAYEHAFVEAERTTEHEVTLSGLEPGTQYYYRIIDDGNVLAGGSEFRFRTDAGREQVDFQFFVTADIGVDGHGSQALTQARIRAMTFPARFGLLAGDIVYPSGDSDDYDTNLMTPWAELLCNTPVWPALGNHDWQSDPEKNFVREWALPGNEHYYSFDYGNAHFIALDTKSGSLYDEEAQLAWLEQDLAANTDATWTFVYFHYPLITCTYKGNEPEMAAQLTPLFERYDVDIVFTGHAHTYERLFPNFRGVPLHEEQDPHYQDPAAPIYVVSGCGGKKRSNRPTTYCGPTAFFLDERILFTQVYIRDRTLWMLTIESATGIVVDAMSIEKSLLPTDARTVTPRSQLLGNVPNPFNPATFVSFELPARTRVQLDVYGVDGTWITRLAERDFGAGLHRVLWDGMDAAGRPSPSGMYVIRMQSDGTSHSRKITLLR